MHVQPDRSAHHHLRSSPARRGSRRAERHLRIRARGAPGQVAGAASYTSGLAAHKNFPACPTAFSQSPCPGTRRTYDPVRTLPQAPGPFSCRYTTSRDLTTAGAGESEVERRTRGRRAEVPSRATPRSRHVGASHPMRPLGSRWHRKQGAGVFARHEEMPAHAGTVPAYPPVERPSAAHRRRGAAAPERARRGDQGVCGLAPVSGHKPPKKPCKRIALQQRQNGQKVAAACARRSRGAEKA
jgi:hypothetical protein